MFGLAFPPIGLWPFAIISQTAYLWFLRDKKPADARNFGLVYGVASAFATMHWLFGLFGAHALPPIFLFAAYYGVLGNLIALTRNRGGVVRSLIVAMFAVAIEWLRGDAWQLRFPWYTVPHALAITPFLILPVRIFGAYGFSCLIWFIESLGCFKKPVIWVAFLLLPVLSLTIPASSPPDSHALVVQAEGIDAVEPIIANISVNPVTLAVLPEYSYIIEPEKVLSRPLGPASLARRFQCPTVFGAVDGSYGTKDFQNVAVILDQTGRLIGKFPKQRPVPLFMDGRPGKTRPVFPMAGGVMGVAVCYDFDAPAVAASLVRRGATVLVAPTFDAASWGRIQHIEHELLLRLRAVELNRWIVRSSSSGRSESISPSGQPSSEGVEIGQAGFARVPYAHQTGLSPAAFMDYFGPIAVAVSATLLLLIFIRRMPKHNDRR